MSRNRRRAITVITAALVTATLGLAATIPANAGGSRPDKVSDISGDGFADVLALQLGGGIRYYAHNGPGLSEYVALPYRYGHPEISPRFDDVSHVMSADWSGDGSADLLAVHTFGTQYRAALYYYPHNREYWPGYRRMVDFLGEPINLGVGWEGTRHVMAADWSGDGYADVLAVDEYGQLLYYPHNGNGLSAPTNFGLYWKDRREVLAADWSGDGYADIVSVHNDGTMWYHPHTGDRLDAPQYLGEGWGGFPHIMAMDWSGDGFADIVAVDSYGQMWYYPHNGAGLSQPSLVGTGWVGFSHIF